MKSLLLAVACLVVWVPNAWGTAQYPERIRLGGREFPLQATPLESWLETLPERPAAVSGAGTSALWRGYRGTWAIECGRLVLVGLEVGGTRRPAAWEAMSWAPMPLTRLFARPGRCVFASWYSGVLRIPEGREMAYVHMGLGTVYERTREIVVERGCVRSSRMLTWREYATQSIIDRQWASIGTRRPVHADPWVDARWIGAGDGTLGPPAETRFRTRGILISEDDDHWASLWIQEGLVTREVFLPFEGPVPAAPDRTWPHVEVEVTWHAGEDGPFLRAHTLRALEAGETMHHPAFDLTAARRAGVLDEAALARRAQDPGARSWGDDGSFEDVLGWHLEVHGTLRSGGGVMQVVGRYGDPTRLEVASIQAPEGASVVVSGELRKWVITAAMLRRCPKRFAAFARRGPGTYYRLVDPATGRLAVPRLDP